MEKKYHIPPKNDSSFDYLKNPAISESLAKYLSDNQETLKRLGQYSLANPQLTYPYTKIKHEYYKREPCDKLFRMVQNLTITELRVLIEESLPSFNAEYSHTVGEIDHTTEGREETYRRGYLSDELLNIYPVFGWLKFYNYVIPEVWNNYDDGRTLIELILDDLQHNLVLLKDANEISSMGDDMDVFLREEIENDEEIKGDGSTFRQELTVAENEGIKKLLICVYMSIISKCHAPSESTMGFAYTKKARGIKQKRKRNKNTKKKVKRKEHMKKKPRKY
jgi:hypothetical protein